MREAMMGGAMIGKDCVTGMSQPDGHELDEGKRLLHSGHTAG